MAILISPTLQTETDPQPAPNSNALTVLFAEVSGQALVGARADIYAHQAMDRHEQLASGVIQKRHGRVVKTMDGSVMADFPGPASAVRAAIDMERAWLEFNQSLPLEQQLDLRIGIHACAGERVAIDLFGDSVSVAAAITKLAAPGQVLVSRSVHEAISSESDLHSQWFNQVAIAGRTERHDIFEAHWADAPTNIPARYEVLSQVGAGGMGMVYKVRDVETGETIALKVLKSGSAADPAMQESLRREVCLARKVTHKNVCRIHDFNRANGTASISMEFVDGESLLARLHRVGAFSWSEALEITRQICAGLREAHAQGIVHRDLKPANIMVDPNGTVKIMDFGIARLFQADGHMTGTLVGTPAYMAPEQVDLKSVDARTDIYALGLLLYEMVTAVPAFAGDTPIAIALKQLREFPQRPRELVPSLPPFAEALILKCMQKDPAARFASVDQLQTALEQKPKVKKVKVVGSRVVPVLLQAIRQIQGVVRSKPADAVAFLQRQDWSAFRAKRARHVVAATLGLAVLLTGGFVLVHARNRAGGTDSAVVSAAAASPSWPDPQSTSTAGAPTGMMRMESVSIFNPTPAPADANAANAPEPDAAQSVNSASREASVAGAGLPDLTHSSAIRDNVRNLARSQVAAAPSHVSRKTTGRLVAAAHPLPATPATSVPMALATTDGSSGDQEAQEIHPNPSPVAVTAAQPEDSHASVPPASDGNDSSAHPAAPAVYLEVGSFKDAAWADSAVEKLTALGFHAVSVHKAHLWMQSYHVQVGPYASPKEVESAQQSLEQQGLKPHLVK